MANKLGKDLDFNNVSKILNLPQAGSAGEAVEYQQFIDAMATIITTDIIKTDPNATAGNLLDAPTIKTYVDTSLSDLVNSAPEAYNTLGEIATWVSAHQDLYDALITTVGNKLDTSKVTTDINAVAGNVPDAPTVKTALDLKLDTSKVQADLPNAVAGEAADAQAVFNQVNGMAQMMVGHMDFPNVNLVADTNYEIVHNCNCDVRKFTIEASYIDGSGNVIDVDVQKVQHDTDTLNKFYIKANADFTGLYVNIKA